MLSSKYLLHRIQSSYWLWQFIEFLQCFLELRTVHCCSASRSTVCRVLLLHKKATGISIWMGTRLQTAAQTLPRKEVSWRSLTAHLYPSHPDPHHWDLYRLQLEAVKMWKSKNSEQMFVSTQHKNITDFNSFFILNVKLPPAIFHS